MIQEKARPRTFIQFIWLALVALGLGLAFGLSLSCSANSASTKGTSQSAERDGDLLAILPSGMDVVFDLDTTTLKELAPEVRRQLQDLLPPSALATLGGLGEDTIELFAAAVRGLGTDAVEMIALARFRTPQLGADHVKKLLPGELAPKEETYHGTPLYETADRSLALLSPRTVALGGRVAIRQVIDTFHGDGDPLRGQRPLMEALAKAPRAKRGRPALLFALLPTPPLRDRLRKAQFAELGADADYISGALAAGDGIDIGLVMGFRHLDIARDVAQRLQEGVSSLARRPMLKSLGLLRFVEPLIVVAAKGGDRKTEPEVHVAYRLSGSELADLLVMLGKLKELRRPQPQP